MRYDIAKSHIDSLGVMGAVSCNPFELVKTRLQSAASGKMAVGHQHGYTSVTLAILQIYKQEGIRGLYRGSFLSMGRSIVGSGANLSSFSIMREYLYVERKWKDVCYFHFSINSFRALCSIASVD